MSTAVVLAALAFGLIALRRRRPDHRGQLHRHAGLGGRPAGASTATSRPAPASRSGGHRHRRRPPPCGPRWPRCRGVAPGIGTHPAAHPGGRRRAHLPGGDADRPGRQRRGARARSTGRVPRCTRCPARDAMVGGGIGGPTGRRTRASARRQPAAHPAHPGRGADRAGSAAAGGGRAAGADRDGGAVLRGGARHQRAGLPVRVRLRRPRTPRSRCSSSSSWWPWASTTTSS